MKKIAVLLGILSLNVWSHGGDKPGPHGGKIMMPGNFHTELLMNEKEIKVYLLDMKFTSPLTENSSAKVSIEHHSKKDELNCTVEKDAFTCKLHVPMSMIEKVEIEAKRNKDKGKAVYFIKNPATTNSHAGH